MRLRLIPFTLLATLFLAAACNSRPTPDQLREKTAQDTATLKQDTQAVAQGIKEGLTDKSANKNPIDINKASKEMLITLPGIDAHRADRIIAERPYTDKYQVVSRGAISDNEYAKIQDQITITH